MRVPVRGQALPEGVQTGDGRVMVEGSVEWMDPPMPLAWLQNEMHGDVMLGAVQVGTIDTLTRDADGMIRWTGHIDDDQPDGAEMVRRMRNGTASHGHRQGLSVDPDNWQVELRWMGSDEGEEGIIILAAAGEGRYPTVRELVAAAGIRAAAGDPDPGDEGELIWTDSSDEIIARFTRSRLRGATLCSIPAFTEAYCELATDEAEATVTAAAPAPQRATPNWAWASADWRPERDWFYMPEPGEDDERLVEQYAPDGSYLGLACPLTIEDDGRVYGHGAASWGQCHVGYRGECVTPPASASDYSRFHVHQADTADGPVNVGPAVVGCDHAAARMMAADARDHYAHSGLRWANLRASNGRFAPWLCGALMPGLDPDVLPLLRGTTFSGDWRSDPGLELIVALSVSGPGFPVAREALAASGLPMLAAAASAPTLYLADGEPRSLVAAQPASRCPECARRRAEATSGGAEMGEVLRLLRAVELRTRHLRREAALAAKGTIQIHTHGPGPEQAKAIAESLAGEVRRSLPRLRR